LTRSSDPIAIAIAGEAFTILGAALRPVAERYLLAAFGDDWRRRSGLLSQIGEESAVHSLDDTGEVLAQLLRRETRPSIAPALAAAGGDRPTLAALHTLRDLRNRWAHFTGLEARDCVRIVAEARSVLASFGVLDPVTADALEALEGQAAAQMDTGRHELLTALRAAYVESVLAATAQIDLAGISPMADARMLRISLPDLFVAPEVGKPDPDPDDDAAETERVVREMMDYHGEDDAYADTARLAVLGSPGAGKSTLLRSVARRAILGADGPRMTPVLVRANQLSGSLEREAGLTLRRYLTHRSSDRFGPLIDEEIRVGAAWLLIDGLDEVPDAKMRSNLAAAIDRYCADEPDCRVWVTSRPIGFDLGPASARFEVVEVKPFDDFRITLFSQRWAAIGHEGREPSKDLAEEILGSSALTELARTPLLLTILALLWQRGTRLPEQRLALYQIATDTLLRDWPFHRQAAEIELPTVMDILQAVALRMIETGDESIREGELVPLAAAAISRQDGSSTGDARRAARRMLRTIEETTGFFIADGRDVDGSVFRFIHRTFAEYLAARALLDGWADGSIDLAGHLHRPEWATTIELLFAYASEVGPGIATKLVKSVVDLEEPLERRLHGNLRLVVKALASGVRTRAEARDDVLRRGLDFYLDPDREPPPIGFAEDLAGAIRRSDSRSTKALRPDRADPAAIRSRKVVLAFMIDPSDTNLAGLLEMARDPITSGDRPLNQLEFILRPLVSTPFAFTGTILVIPPHVQMWIPDDVGERFGRLGLPSISLHDAISDPLAVAEAALIVVDPQVLTVDDIVGAHRPSMPDWLGPMLVAVEPWHDAHRTEIEGLVAEAAAVPARLATFAARCYLEVSEEGAEAWLPVLAAMLTRGDRPAFHAAWRSILAFAPDDETFEAIADKAASWIPARRPEMLRAFVEGLGTAESWSTAFGDAVETQLTAEDPTLRGMARRVLAGHRRNASVLTLLIEDSAFDPITDDGGAPSDAEPETTRRLIDALLALDVPSVGPEMERGIGLALERVLSRSPLAQTEMFHTIGPMRVHPVAEEIARTSVLSDRPETRSWAARILRDADRDTAASELEVLLSDPVAEVRSIAATAVGPEDLEETSWLLRALPEVFRSGDTDAAARIAQVLRDEVEPHPDPQIVRLLEEHLDSDPGNEGALRFASIYLLYVPAFHFALERFL
jgi:hypothetical protein